MTERQVAGIAVSACILSATIALVLATGVPVGPLCVAVAMYLGRATGAVSELHMVTDKPANQTGLVTSSDLEWARSTSTGAIFAATTAIMIIVMLILHLLNEVGMLRSVRTTLCWVSAAHMRVGRGIVRAACRLPAQIRIVMTAVGTGAIVLILFCLVRGTDGRMTESKTASTRSVVLKMPVTIREVAQEITFLNVGIDEEVYPYCSMVPEYFPGLMRKPGGGLTVAESKLGTMPLADARSGDEGNTDDGDTLTDGSGDGGVDTPTNASGLLLLTDGSGDGGVDTPTNASGDGGVNYHSPCT